jgi:hypothetical protein
MAHLNRSRARGPVDPVLSSDAMFEPSVFECFNPRLADSWQAWNLRDGMKLAQPENFVSRSRSLIHRERKLS